MIPKLKEIAKDIFNELGSGHEEAIYQKAFEVALRLEKIAYESQKIVPVFYKKYNVGIGRPDIIVNDSKGKILIELKAISSTLSLKEETQVRKYIEVLGIKDALLINFPQPSSKEVPNLPEFREVKL
ncbi:MAG TPA: GxxExxY protein [Candidatus Nanoarchaeia archaeon]|nr:GxxExxY protein [Candidatus Nanoarchaeia archaeon]